MFGWGARSISCRIGEQVTPDTLLTLRQASEQTGLGERTIQRKAREGSFPTPAHCGRSIRFSQREVQAWIQERLGERTSA